VRVDHVGGAQGDAFFFIQHAEGAGELAAVVGEVPDRQAVQVGMFPAPAQLGVLVVGRAAQDHRVALLELTAQAGELGDLGRADEGEVLRVEEDDLPLAGEALVVERLEGALAILFMAVELGLHARDLELRQLLANTQHQSLRTVCVVESRRLVAARGEIMLRRTNSQSIVSGVWID
jgi:hypothetical protein